MSPLTNADDANGTASQTTATNGTSNSQRLSRAKRAMAAARHKALHGGGGAGTNSAHSSSVNSGHSCDSAKRASSTAKAARRKGSSGSKNGGAAGTVTSTGAGKAASSGAGGGIAAAKPSAGQSGGAGKQRGGNTTCGSSAAAGNSIAFPAPPPPPPMPMAMGGAFPFMPSHPMQLFQQQQQLIALQQQIHYQQVVLQRAQQQLEQQQRSSAATGGGGGDTAAGGGMTSASSDSTMLAHHSHPSGQRPNGGGNKNSNSGKKPLADGAGAYPPATLVAGASKQRQQAPTLGPNPTITIGVGGGLLGGPAGQHPQHLPMPLSAKAPSVPLPHQMTGHHATAAAHPADIAELAAVGAAMVSDGRSQPAAYPSTTKQPHHYPQQRAGGAGHHYHHPTPHAANSIVGQGLLTPPAATAVPIPIPNPNPQLAQHEAALAAVNHQIEALLAASSSPGPVPAEGYGGVGGDLGFDYGAPIGAAGYDTSVGLGGASSLYGGGAPRRPGPPFSAQPPAALGGTPTTAAEALSPSPPPPAAPIHTLEGLIGPFPNASAAAAARLHSSGAGALGLGLGYMGGVEGAAAAAMPSAYPSATLGLGGGAAVFPSALPAPVPRSDDNHGASLFRHGPTSIGGGPNPREAYAAPGNGRSHFSAGRGPSEVAGGGLAPAPFAAPNDTFGHSHHQSSYSQHRSAVGARPVGLGSDQSPSPFSATVHPALRSSNTPVGGGHPAAFPSAPRAFAPAPVGGGRDALPPSAGPMAPLAVAEGFGLGSVPTPTHPATAYPQQNHQSGRRAADAAPGVIGGGRGPRQPFPW